MTIGRKRFVRDLHLVFLILAVYRLDRVEPPALALAVLRPREVTGDRVEPRRELCDASVRMAVAIDAEKSLLQEVLTALHITQEAVQVVRQSLRVAMVETLDCFY